MVDAMSDYDGLEDEKFAAIPPPFSPGQGDLDLDLDRDPDQDRERDPFADGDGDGEASALAEVPAAKRRGGARRPQPKLDSSRLSSDKGLPALRTLFDDVRFKGKGHEAADLRVLMQRMENWAHRLFPKLQFEDFVERVEKLGSKKEVQTCLKRIRLDMPLTHDDFGGGEVVEEEEAAAAHVFGAPEPFSSYVDEPRIHSTPAPPAFSSPPAPPTSSSTPGPALSEEQRRRMELNRQRALERRLAARQQPAESQTEAAAAAPEGPSHLQKEEKEEDSATPEGPTHFPEEEDSEPVSSLQQNQQLTSIDSEPPAVEDGSPAPTAE